MMENVTIAHGAGGKITHDLIEKLFFRELGNEVLERAEDSAIVDINGTELAFTTDSFVVTPPFFPGGDIGKIAVCGTVNDLAVAGARPLYISCGFIIEEGFPMDRLKEVVRSVGIWSEKAGVMVVTGDTKVVEKGEADGIFINTSGIGVLEGRYKLRLESIRPGDKVILTGTIGDHGLSVLSARKDFKLESDIKSDCAPLNGMLEGLLPGLGEVRFMRDPTRGGLATTLNEMTKGRDFSITIEEKKIPVSGSVKGACELFGFDPLYMANEGKAVIVVDPEAEERTLETLKSHEYGRGAVAIGEVSDKDPGKVFLLTRLGVTRIIDMLAAEQLPRIC